MREMGIDAKYSIDYRQIENGRHTFDFDVDGALFAAMESNEIKDGRCRVHVVLDRAERVLVLATSISGSVTVECDRCLEDCPIAVEWSGTLTVHLTDGAHDYDGETMWIASGEPLSLAQYIYESIVISLPYRRVHPDGGCNPDMLARFTPADAETAGGTNEGDVAAE